MGNSLTIYALNYKTGKKERLGSYRCRSCAKKRMPKKIPVFIQDSRGKMIFYNTLYKNIAEEKGWKLKGQEVKE